MKYFQAGSVISVELRNMTNYLKIVRNILNLLKKRLVYQSRWYQMVRKDMTSFIVDKEYKFSIKKDYTSKAFCFGRCFYKF